MTQEERIADLQDIFRDVMDNDSIIITPETTALDIEEWDSISHIQLIVAIEKKYKIKFTAAEIQSFKNVGDLLTALQQKGI
jgi:acyl carrier protein